MKIAVLTNLKKDAPESLTKISQRTDDLDHWITVEKIIHAFEGAGHEARYIPGEIRYIQEILAFNPDICFNFSEGHFGTSREAQIPAILDAYEIPYTGSGVLGMSLSHDKAIAKRMFRGAGLPTPASILINDPYKIPKANLRYPLFVKPASEGSSIGINENAVVHNETELKKQVEWVWNLVKSAVLVEEYIQGREFSIGVVGNEVLPIIEIITPTGFYSNSLKKNENDLYCVCPALLDKNTTRKLKEIAIRGMECLNIHDFCRMDLRLDSKQNPYILEINPLPNLHPDPRDGFLILAANAAGWSYEQLVNRILLAALKRYDLILEPATSENIVPWVMNG